MAFPAATVEHFGWNASSVISDPQAEDASSVRGDQFHLSGMGVPADIEERLPDNRLDLRQSQRVYRPDGANLDDLDIDRIVEKRVVDRTLKRAPKIPRSLAHAQIPNALPAPHDQVIRPIQCLLK